jgi:hypothetical protein
MGYAAWSIVPQAGIPACGFERYLPVFLHYLWRQPCQAESLTYTRPSPFERTHAK